MASADLEGNARPAGSVPLFEELHAVSLKGAHDLGDSLIGHKASMIRLSFNPAQRDKRHSRDGA